MSRKLNLGYSSILGHEGRLYTMYRADNNREVIISSDADPGETGTGLAGLGRNDGEVQAFWARVRTCSTTLS